MSTTRTNGLDKVPQTVVEWHSQDLMIWYWLSWNRKEVIWFLWHPLAQLQKMILLRIYHYSQIADAMPFLQPSDEYTFLCLWLLMWDNLASQMEPLDGTRDDNCSWSKQQRLPEKQMRKSFMSGSGCRYKELWAKGKMFQIYFIRSIAFVYDSYFTMLGAVQIEMLVKHQDVIQRNCGAAQHQLTLSLEGNQQIWIEQ
jgi:hypothetical protein